MSAPLSDPSAPPPVGGDTLAEFTDSTPLLEDPEALLARFEEDGYVYLRGVVDTGLLAEAREAITTVCAAHGWLVPGTDPMDAIPRIEPRVEGEPQYFEVYDDVQRLQSFHAVPHDPSVRRCMTPLLGETAFPHPLSIARLSFPDNDEWATPEHQDYPNNQGTTELYACWIPLGDCPVELGGLSILRGSHRFGVLPLRAALGAGHRRATLDERFADLEWVGGDFAAGDALVFHSLTVHRSLPNRSDRLRLSVDYRFQREGDALTEGCLEPHFGRVAWEDVYATWDRDDLKYYWRDKAYTVEPWDAALFAVSDEDYEEHMRQWLLWRRRHPKVDGVRIDPEAWQRRWASEEASN